MAIIKLGAHLPDGDKNGLVRISPSMVDDPHAVHVAVVLLDCKQLTTNADDDTVTPLARIRHVEPLTSVEDVTTVTAALRRAFEQRTGKVELPFEMTQDAERITLAERDQLPDASEVLGDQAPDDVDQALPPEPTAGPTSDEPAEWDTPEGTEPAPADDNVRAFASPFRPAR